MAQRLVAANDNNEFRFYIYVWCYPDGRPFYVGKGNGRRSRDAAGRNKIFQNIVAKIRRSGEEPTIKRWQEGLCEEGAFKLEAAYIKLFGRRDIGTGILANMTDGGEGASGVVRSAEAIEGTASAHRGRKRSPETGAKITAANLGRRHTEAHRAANSAAKMGVRRSDEYRAAMRMKGPRSGYKGDFFPAYAQ